MNSRDELEAFVMLIRAMNGEKNVIENMEAEGQERAVSSTKMARKMYPSREDWEELGFSFTDILDDDVLCKATLPEGWSLKKTEHPMWNEIFDNNGMKRGTMFYKSSFYDRSAHMSLLCRYKVCTDYLDEAGDFREIYFGNEDEKLFVAGRVKYPKNASREDIIRITDEEDKLKELAKKFAEENYPDYENVHAYWDTKKELKLVPKNDN